MRVISVIGYSESGKTTLVEYLIRYFVGKGRTVAAIKHTHHPLESRRRGDTSRYQRAGASAVFLAGDQSALLWPKDGEPDRLRFRRIEDLIDHVSADLLIVEGFKENPLGVAILVERAHRERVSQIPPNVIAVVTDGETERALPTFPLANPGEVAAFLDRIIST